MIVHLISGSRERDNSQVIDEFSDKDLKLWPALGLYVEDYSLLLTHQISAKYLQIRLNWSYFCFFLESAGCGDHLEFDLFQKLKKHKCVFNNYFLKVSWKSTELFVRYFAKSYFKTCFALLFLSPPPTTTFYVFTAVFYYTSVIHVNMFATLIYLIQNAKQKKKL